MKTSPFMLQLGDKSYALAWDNGAVFRADDTGLADKLAKGKFGYSVLCRMIHVMLDDKGRDSIASPEAVAALLPVSKQVEAWAVVMAAHAAGTGNGDSEAKKMNGGGEPSPASS